MQNPSTMNKLLQMRLTAMADAYRIQSQDVSLQSLSFEERFNLLVDTEYTSRKNNRLKRLIKQARFDQSHAFLGDIHYEAGRKLDRDLIHRLAGGEYIVDKHNIIILGASGAGKSYLSCALGMEACKQFHTVRFTRLPELLNELAIARGEGSYRRALEQYRKVNLLILDEWMLLSLTETEARDVLELVHARHKQASTIFCSQFSPAGWHGKIGEATLADAILDRIVHDSYVIEIQNGSQDYSMRERYGINRKNI